MSTHSAWSRRELALSPAPLDGRVTADVVVVGAGVTGVVTAALLHEAGLDVVVVDRYGVAEGDTGRSTAHLTEMVDGRYHEIARRFGQPGARLVADASRAAIDEIERLCGVYGLTCGFERVSACMYAQREEDLPELDAEGAAAKAAGVPVTFTDDVPLPFHTSRGFMVPNQGKVQPVEFVTGLARALQQQGVRFFGSTAVTEVDDDSAARVQTTSGQVSAAAVFMATHTPVHRRFSFHTKLTSSRTYVVAGPAPDDHSPALCWDLDDPYHYIRTQPTPAGALLVIGGADHALGDEDAPRRSLEDIRAYASQRYPSVEFSWQWSGEIYTSLDGLPLIGRTSPGAHSYLGTGYAGNGMTYGVVAARLFHDLFHERESELSALLAPSRMIPVDTVPEFVKHNVSAVSTLVLDRVTSNSRGWATPADLPPGEGAVFTEGSRSIAAARDAEGALHRVSANCTHLGCHVRWNGVERSWDCPCHGSRFGIDGAVLNGPAVTNLSPES